MGGGKRIYIIQGTGRTDERDDVTIAIPSSGYLTVDASRCSGCRDCEMVCTLAHEGLSAPSLARLTVRHDPFADDHPEVFVCPQCRGPECVLACPRGAISADERTGARVVEPDLCDGCGLCVKACHLGMIWVDADTRIARKCDLCDGEPQCVLHCPQNVIAYRKKGRP